MFSRQLRFAAWPSRPPTLPPTALLNTFRLTGRSSASIPETDRGFSSRFERVAGSRVRAVKARRLTRLVVLARGLGRRTRATSRPCRDNGLPRVHFEKRMQIAEVVIQTLKNLLAARPLVHSLLRPHALPRSFAAEGTSRDS
mgnify:CR=1 FL=1